VAAYRPHYRDKTARCQLPSVQNFPPKSLSGRDRLPASCFSLRGSRPADLRAVFHHRVHKEHEGKYHKKMRLFMAFVVSRSLAKHILRLSLRI
jgi:hypothetical protein